MAYANKKVSGQYPPVRGDSTQDWIRRYQEIDVERGTLKAENTQLRAALDKMQTWFSSDLGAAISNSEYLLGGCPNELRVDIENARAALAPKK
jgi:hypothetical protein